MDDIRADFIERRLDKIDEAIQRLATVATDMSRMLALHELRISQHEESQKSLLSNFEGIKVADIAKIEKITAKVSLDLKEAMEEEMEREKGIERRVSKLEKMIWMALGGGSIISFLIVLVVDYFKVHAH